MRKVLAIAALLGSAGVGVANAAPVPATMVTVGSFSKNSTTAALWAVTANNTATWTFDTATSTLAMASGTYERRVKAGASVLMTHTMTGTAFGPGAATGATWTCTEGVFGGLVGAHICGNYNLGADFINDSTYNQSTPDAISATVTLAGDDYSLGAVQTLVNSYSTMTAAAVAGAAPGFQRYTLNNGQDLFPGAGDTATGFDAGYIFTFDIATGPLDAVPVISDGYITTFEDNASGAFAPTITLGDGTAAQHTLAVTTQGANGSCVVTPGDATGTVVYTPNASYTGTDSCVLTLTDSDSDSDTATISVTVNTVAANDDGPITAGQSVVTVIPVGANDQGFIDPVTITVTTPPLHGTIAAISPAGPAASRTISYVANAGYTGPDSFVYTMSDGSRTDTAAVNLTVTDSSPVPATMVTVGSFSKNSTSAALWAVTANDTATWTFDTATSTLAMASGTYERRVKAGAAVLMTHTMTGTAFGPGTATGTTWLCTEGAFGGVVGAHICGNYNLGADFTNNSTYNQSTPDAISATVTLAGDDFSLGAVQTLVNSYSTMTAAAVAGAAPGFQRYTLTNGQDLSPGAGDTATGFDTGYIFTFDVSLAPPPPDAVNDGPVTVFGSDATLIPVGMNDTGFGNPVGVLVTTNPAKGTATVTTAPGPVTGQVISYTANVGATGVDTFVYTVDDGLNIDSATVTINISAPDAVNDGPVSAMQFLPTLVPVGANDRGFSDPVTVTVTDLPEHGTITAISGAGPAATRTITYRSDASYLGADSFVYTMTDGNSSDTAQVTVAVVPDTTPGARDDNANAFSGVPLAINVRANDLGFDSGAALGIQTNPLHGAAVVGGTPGAQTIVYTSDADFHGIDTFEYTIDGVSLSDTALVTVMVALDADHDGIEDGIDNCLGAANPGQQDTDTDGFGNWCDADFNNDGRVNYADLAEFRSKFGGTDAEANLDSVGPVNFADLARFKALFGKPPGPSGQVP